MYMNRLPNRMVEVLLTSSDKVMLITTILLSKFYSIPFSSTFTLRKLTRLQEYIKQQVHVLLCDKNLPFS